jgi:hypothetical protein
MLHARQRSNQFQFNSILVWPDQGSNTWFTTLKVGTLTIIPMIRFWLQEQDWLVWFMEFNTTFNNISVISLRSVLLMEATRVPKENNRTVASHWQTLSHNVVSSKPRNKSGDKICEFEPNSWTWSRFTANPYLFNDGLIYISTYLKSFL